MIEARARVLALDGDSAEVETDRDACSGCAASGGCGLARLGTWFGPARPRLRVHNPIQAQPGEPVVIGLSEQALARTTRILHGLPLGGLLGGLLAGQALGAGMELAALGGGLLGLIAGFLGAAVWSRRAVAVPRVLCRAKPPPVHR